MSVQKLLLDYLTQVEYMVTQDVENSSDEIFEQNLGGSARPATNYMTEAGFFCSYTARYIKDPENTEFLKAGPQPDKTEAGTKRKSNIFLIKGFKDLRRAIESMTDEELSEPITAPWLQQITKSHLVMHALGHANYHLGQLAMTQLIQGDQNLYWIKQQ
ncbi:MAG: hypothetical protein ACKVQS_06470 [Fimbriimonadaceae bacterium]